MTAWIILLSALSATSLVIAFNWVIWVVLGVIALIIVIRLLVLIMNYYKQNKNTNLDNKLKEKQIKALDHKEETKEDKNEEGK